MPSQAKRPPETLSTPPYWRALNPDELAHYGDVQACAVTPTPGADWLPGVFRAAIPGCGEVLIHGWVRPPFALHQAFTDRLVLGQISPLTTGNIVGTFRTIPEAALAAAVLGPVADWDHVSVETAHTVVDAVVDAIEGVGFRHAPVRVGACVVPVWGRGALH